MFRCSYFDHHSRSMQSNTHITHTHTSYLQTYVVSYMLGTHVNWCATAEISEEQTGKKNTKMELNTHNKSSHDHQLETTCEITTKKKMPAKCTQHRFLFPRALISFVLSIELMIIMCICTMSKYDVWIYGIKTEKNRQKIPTGKKNNMCARANQKNGTRIDTCARTLNTARLSCSICHWMNKRANAQPKMLS